MYIILSVRLYRYIINIKIGCAVDYYIRCYAVLLRSACIAECRYFIFIGIGKYIAAAVPAVRQDARSAALSLCFYRNGIFC